MATLLVLGTLAGPFREWISGCAAVVAQVNRRLAGNSPRNEDAFGVLVLCRRLNRPGEGTACGAGDLGQSRLNDARCHEHQRPGCMSRGNSFDGHRRFALAGQFHTHVNSTAIVTMSACPIRASCERLCRIGIDGF